MGVSYLRLMFTFVVSFEGFYHGETLTFLSLTGSGVIVSALNLFLLQVRFETGQVCIQPSDVLVNLNKSIEKKTQFFGGTL